MPKRKKGIPGFGTVFRRKDDGRYVAKFKIEETGKYRILYAKTEKEAQELLEKAWHEQKQGKLVTGPNVKLGDHLHQWLESVCKPPALRISTYVKYEKLINTHLIPALGNVYLQKLTPQQVQTLYTKKLSAGLSPKMVNSIHGVLHSALDVAMKWNLVSRNVCGLVSPPRIVKPEIQPLTMEQAHQLLQAAKGHRLETLLALALTTGMRRGELLALRWADIDLKSQKLQIRRTVDYIAHYGYVETEPKTKAGKRTISLPPFVLDMLKQHRVQQLEQRLKVGSAWEEMHLVFTDLHGGYINPRYILKLFDKLLKNAGLPHMRFHDLRHSAATLLLVMGVHPKVVQEILGHSNVNITLDTYSHVLPSLHQEAILKWNDTFGASNDDENRGSK